VKEKEVMGEMIILFEIWKEHTHRLQRKRGREIWGSRS